MARLGVLRGPGGPRVGERGGGGHVHGGHVGTPISHEGVVKGSPQGVLYAMKTSFNWFW